MARIYTEKDGLPTATVFCVLRDECGVLWIGHERGLSRFDGSIWQHVGATEGLSNAVLGLEIYNGRLWCGTTAGIYRIDTVCVRGVTRLKASHIKEFGTNNSPVLVVWKGRLWVTSCDISFPHSHPANRETRNRGLLWCESRGSKYVYGEYSAKDGLAGNGVVGFAVAGDSLVVVSSGVTSVHYSGGRFFLRPLFHNIDQILQPPEPAQLWAYATAVPSGIVISRQYLYLLKNGRIEMRNRLGTGFAKWKDSLLWLVQPGIGIVLLDRDMRRVRDRIDTDAGLANNYTHNHLFFDSDGSVWIPSLCGLTHLISLSARRFPLRRSVHGICEMNGEVLMGVEDKLFTLNGNGYLQERSMPLVANKASQSFITDISTHRKDLFATVSGDLLRFRGGRTNSAEIILSSTTEERKKRIPYSVRRFIILEDGGIAFAMNRMFGYLHPEKFRRPFFWDTTASSSGNFRFEGGLPGAKVLCLLQRENKVWLGTNRGLAVFDPEKRAISKVPWPSLSRVQAAIYDLTQHGNERLLIAADDGIWIADSTRLRKCVFPSGFKHAYSALSAGNFIIIGGDQGLCVFRDTVLTRVVTEAEGLTHRGVTHLFRDSRSRIYALTASGVSIYDESELLRECETPKVAIHLIEVNGQVQFAHLLPTTPAVPQIIESRRPYSSLLVRCVSSSTAGAREIEYRFHLRGDDTLFTSESAEPVCVFSNISPGDWRCEVQARHLGGSWSPPAAFIFHVPMPVYMRWWFIASLAALLLLL
ncbi:MAG: hypothetical protein QHI48_06240, partial [Bacteroidota bacterium]|nr:hypothetical protein [Bacteroidota bacterium]